MRTLSATLLAAQRSASGAPYLRVEAHDRIGGTRRLGWTRHYAGGESDGYHAACMPSDGSLVRARVTGGRVYYQRVTAPGPTSDYSMWTDLGVAANAGAALCADGARVMLFFVDSSGTQITLRESTDNGATLAAGITAATGAGAVTWLAADVKPGGDACLVFSVGATVYAARRTSGVWSSPSAWSNTAASIAGLAVYHQGDWNAAIAGTDATGQAFLWTAVFGDGFLQASGTWSAFRELARASAGSSVAFRAPFLSRPDTSRLTFVEKYTGAVAYSRPYHAHAIASADFPQNLWREPVPFNLASEYGQAIAFSATTAWLSTPSGVWSAPLDTPSLDLTADVLECQANDVPFGGSLRLVLRNDDGRYSTLPAQLKLNGELRVAPGYATTAGPEASDGPYYWIEGIERHSGGGEATLVITARNAWGLLEAWRARRTYAWAAGQTNVFGILQYVFSRAGLEFASAGASSEASSLAPAFTIHPGETALTAVRRLLAMLPDVIFLRGEFAFLKEPLAPETSAYSYGTTHAIRSGRYRDDVEPNRVQVHGRGVFGERFDWPTVEVATDRLVEVHDTNLLTQTALEDRADAVLRHAAIDASGGEITAAPHCGQELYDVIEITDSGAGLAAAKRRVVGIETMYRRIGRASYSQRLVLGGE